MLLFDSNSNPSDKKFVEVYTIPGSALDKESVCFENYEDLAKNFTSAELERLKHHGLSPKKVKAQKVWISKNKMFYEPYLGDNEDVKKTEKSNNIQSSSNNNQNDDHDAPYDLDLEGDGKYLWKYSYLKNKKSKKESDVKDLMHYKVQQMMDGNKLYYDPMKGYIRNSRLIDTSNNEPLLMAEKISYPIEIHHYSNKVGLSEINPDFMHGPNKTAIYHINKPENNDSKSRYKVLLKSDSKLYDIDLDSDDIIDDALKENDNVWDTDKILNKIKAAGYHGIWAPRSQHKIAKNIIQLFYSHKPELEEIL